jgi:hypothetical protein
MSHGFTIHEIIQDNFIHALKQSMALPAAMFTVLTNTQQYHVEFYQHRIINVGNKNRYSFTLSSYEQFLLSFVSNAR